MMRKVINFSKAFIPCIIISTLIIISGIVGYFMKGINFGLDYRPGLLEEVRFAPNTLDITYNGISNVTLDLSPTQIDVVISGTGAENKTETLLFENNNTVSELAANLNLIEGIEAKVVSNETALSSSLFASTNASNKLSTVPYRLYSSGKMNVDIEEVRNSLSSLDSTSVQQLGGGEDASFQIRIADKGSGKSSIDLQNDIFSNLESKFGKDNIVVMRTDFIGSNFSRSIAFQSVLLLGGAILLILIYATIRFHWDFAIGAIIALVHDCLIMMTFIVWTQMEFSTMIVAAILTIVGYSINATIVVLDRTRMLLPIMKETKKFTDIINQSLTDTLSRTIITTVTTMFAAAALYFFTTGSIENFALALIVGLLSGCYSSMFISSAFISATRKSWKPEYGIHHSLKLQTGVFDTNI